MINYYLLSLASADLLCGVLVVPLSVYPALVRRWVYGDIVCRLVGYLEVTLWAVSVYTFMWISVDRYLAIRYISLIYILYRDILLIIYDKCIIIISYLLIIAIHSCHINILCLYRSYCIFYFIFLLHIVHMCFYIINILYIITFNCNTSYYLIKYHS